MRIDPIREAFEAWYTEKYLGVNIGTSLDRYGDGYKNLDTHYCWLGYQACAAELLPVIKEMRKSLEDIKFQYIKRDVILAETIVNKMMFFANKALEASDKYKEATCA